MSLRERLQQTREQTQAEKDAVALQEAEAKKAQEKKQEAEDVEALRGQIAGLKNKKAELENALGELKKGYESSEGALTDFKKEDENVAGVYEEFKDDLGQQGISSKEDLIGSPAFAEDEEVKKYKQVGANLRGKVESVRSAKNALKEEIPNLNFRGGAETKEDREREAAVKTELEKRYAEYRDRHKKYVEAADKTDDQRRATPEYRALMQEAYDLQEESKKNGFTLKAGAIVEAEKSADQKKTPREKSMEKAEEHIKEIGKQIEALEEQTPERLEEKRKAAECLDSLERDHRLPIFADLRGENTIAEIDKRELFPMKANDSLTDYIAYYSEKFGEPAMKRALFEGLAPKIDKIIEEEKKISEKNHYTFDEARQRARVENMIRAKIESDIAERKAKDFKKENRVDDIEKEDSSNWEEKKTAESYLPSVVRMKLKYQDRSGEEVKTTAFTQYHSYDKPIPLEVNSLAKESPELVKLKRQLDEAQGNMRHAKRSHEDKQKNTPRFFGKDKHQQELVASQEEVQNCEKKVAELERAVKKQEDEERYASKNISELAELIAKSGLDQKLKYQETTIGQLLDKMEILLKENLSKKITPEQEALRKQYIEMLDQARQAEREYRTAKSNY